MAAPSLEDSVAALEARVGQLHKEPEQATAALRGWQRIVGIFQDEPEFEEAVRLGCEWRMADAPADNECADRVIVTEGYGRSGGRPQTKF